MPSLHLRPNEQSAIGHYHRDYHHFHCVGSDGDEETEEKKQWKSWNVTTAPVLQQSRSSDNVLPQNVGSMEEENTNFDDKLDRVRHSLVSSSQNAAKGSVQKEIAPKLDAVISKFGDIQRAWSLIKGRGPGPAINAATFPLNEDEETDYELTEEDEGDDAESDAKTMVVHPSPMMRVHEIDEEEEVEVDTEETSRRRDCLLSSPSPSASLSTLSPSAPALAMHDEHRDHGLAVPAKAAPLRMSRTTSSSSVDDAKNICDVDDVHFGLETEPRSLQILRIRSL